MGNILSSLLDRWFGDDDNIQQPYYFGNLPEPYAIEKIDPKLIFYSNLNGTPVTVDSTSSADDAISFLKSKGFLRGDGRLVIITHGFQSSQDTPWLHQLKDTILGLETADNRQKESTAEQDVAILGWGKGADIGLLKYGQAASNSLRTGHWLGEFLVALRKDPTLEKMQTYGIGHSLGAHLMGVAGRAKSGVLNRITGLDPAGVGFQEDNVDKRLNETDANLVDVIHTDGQDVPYFGTLIPLGLIDFYPNYGWNQPTDDRDTDEKPRFDRNARKNNSNKKRAKPSPFGDRISESHGRSIAYFLWSIQNRGRFRTAMKLEGKPEMEKAVHRIVALTGDQTEEATEAEMGYWCDRQLRKRCTILEPTETGSEPTLLETHARLSQNKGCYYVHTNASVPWC